MALNESWESAVARADFALADKVVHTPVVKSEAIADILLNRLRGCGLAVSSIEVLFKCENLQKAGSFKLRGATHFISKLSESQLCQGLIAYSTGNHALAVACAAKLASEQRCINIPCTVIMPTTASPYKIAAAKKYGANIFLQGNSTADGAILAQKLQKATGAVMIPPSGHEDIMLGQATVMREFAAQADEIYGEPLDLVLVPSAGGALLTGAGIVCEDSKTLVIGTEPERGGADLRIARMTGVRNDTIDQGFTTIAEGLRSLTADLNWRFLCHDRFVHEVFGASESDIMLAMRVMLEELKMVIEPSAAVALAVLLFNEDCLRLLAKRSSWRIGVIISGGNVSLQKFKELLAETE